MSELKKTYVTYEQFGAVGDSVTDDFKAIYDTHVYANEHGLTVLGNPAKVYYIGDSSIGAYIPVTTDVDFGGATFIIDDRNVAPFPEVRYYQIFCINPSNDKGAIKITGDALLGKNIKVGDTNIGFKLDSKSLVTLVNADEQIFIRYGANSGTSNKSEMLLVDKDGYVDPSTPIMWNYDHLTEIYVRPLTEKPITIKNGTFITIANRLRTFTEEEKAKGWLEGNQYYYYNRGFGIKRSNTTVSGISHIVRDEQDGGYPYIGFYGVDGACNVLIENCKMSAHKLYRENRPDGNGTNMGSYDIHCANSVGVTWRNCTQLNSISDASLWPIMCSNFSRNLTYDGCVLSHFDAHQGAWNVTLKNSTIGQLISVVGGGDLILENTKKVYNPNIPCFIYLKDDYGATWQGTVNIKDCVILTPPDVESVNVIDGTWCNWDFGYPCYIPTNIVIDNLKCSCNNINLLDYKYADVGVFDKSDSNINPLIPPKSVIVKNQTQPIRYSKEKSVLYESIERGEVIICGELI